MDKKRLVSVKALEFCEMSTLSKEDFTRLILDYPEELLTKTQNVAAKRKIELDAYRRRNTSLDCTNKEKETIKEESILQNNGGLMMKIKKSHEAG